MNRNNYFYLYTLIYKNRHTYFHKLTNIIVTYFFHVFVTN